LQELYQPRHATGLPPLTQASGGIRSAFRVLKNQRIREAGAAPRAVRRSVKNLWLWRKRRQVRRSGEATVGVSRPRARYVALCLGLGTEDRAVSAAQSVTPRERGAARPLGWREIRDSSLARKVLCLTRR
jgi:hypothetical protein